MFRRQELESGWTRRARELGRQSDPDAGAMICRAVFEELCVLANGDIVCSCADPAGRRTYGNVHRDRIAAVFTGSRYRGMRRAQLAAAPSSFCPVVGADCPLRVWRATPGDHEGGRAIRLLQLEPISRCNLSCPECPVTHFDADPAYRADRVATLPLATMLAVVDQLPDLEKILFFNYGEPFLHPQAIDFLRAVRSRRPQLRVDVSTNGLALTPAKLEAIGAEALVDRLVFSIDGAIPESYERYRVGGRLDRALAALAGAVEATGRHGTANRVEVVWQYILFDWNDSDVEIATARSRAVDLGVRIQWVITHTEGASRRFRADDPDTLARLEAGDPWALLSCNQKQESLSRGNGVAGSHYRAGILLEATHLEVRPRGRFALRLRVENRSQSPWTDPEGSRFMLGVRLRKADGGTLRDLPRIPIAVGGLDGGESTSLLFDAFAPAEAGAYELLLDVVEEGVAWFHERSSRPALCQLSIAGEPATWSGEALSHAALAAFLDRPPSAQEAAWARGCVEAGQPLDALLGDLARLLPAGERTRRLEAARSAAARVLGLAATAG